MDRIIKGKIDKFGFLYLNTSIINPENELSVYKVKTIIDTGAAYSFVKPELLSTIGINNSIGDYESLHPISGKQVSKIFNIKLKIEKFTIPELKVRELKDSSYPCGMIIGIDIIKHCNFSYNFQNKEFNLELFPNIRPIINR